MGLIEVRDGQFWDEEGRTIHLRGINLSGDSKLPSNPDMPSHRRADFWTTDSMSFVGRPFPLKDADKHLSRITSWGYNVIRFVITWESIEHAGPGIYDEEYMTYVVAVLEKCASHGLYVIMDPHQDVWSRYSGGSGAPYWTYIAAGINPKNFDKTQAAIVHNVAENVQEFPRMIWSTNYERLAAATMFILFFAGRHFAPKAIIDDVNIQDYLQNHFFNSMAMVARRIRAKGQMLSASVLGWETMNEPSMSWLGREDLNIIPTTQHLRKGTCPTPFQAIMTGSGNVQQIQVWDFSSTGPKLKGSTVVDPMGTSIWFAEGFSDDHYKWERDQNWRLGSCIWAQHGVWDEQSKCLLRPDYFLRGPEGMIIDDASFLTQFWMPHFRRYKQIIRAEMPDAIIFCQPPVLKIPPIFDELDRKDRRIVYSPHFYDGMTLMNKTWNTWYNVDVLGVLRGRYRSPVFAVKFGLRAIRNCLRDQLLCIKREGLQNLGNYPCLFSEIGIPFDLDNGKAYEDHDYTSQIGALDANNFALEHANVHFTFWHYSVLNTNRWGDYWNGEDLGFVSRRDATEQDAGSIHGSWYTRAETSFVRPAAIRIAGTIEAQSFDLKTRTFSLTVRCSEVVSTGKVPTVIFLPSLQYSSPVTSTSDGSAVHDSSTQRLYWWHDSASAGASVHLTITDQTSNTAKTSLWC